jgi:hypothetical protein
MTSGQLLIWLSDHRLDDLAIDDSIGLHGRVAMSPPAQRSGEATSDDQLTQ